MFKELIINHLELKLLRTKQLTVYFLVIKLLIYL